MLAQLIADGVLLLHFAFILFVILGGLLALWRRGWVWAHLPALLWGVLVELTGWPCPLTPLENWFRRRAGQPGYGGGFIDHYLMPLVYPAGLTTGYQVLLAALLLLVNAVIYAWVIHRWRVRRREHQTFGQSSGRS